MVKQISDNEIYLLIKYIKSILWRVAKCLSYIEEAQCLKVNYEYSWFVRIVRGVSFLASQELTAVVEFVFETILSDSGM